MAILDNFEVTILIVHQSRPNPGNNLEPTWAQVKEYNPPGADTQKSSFNTCRKYIGVPPLQTLDSTHRVNTEFVIDYKVKCGFLFADQNDTGVEYIVFRTYLDNEKIGSASVKRSRWERSGSYRIRKQGKRFRVENNQSWIRQRWMFDPGLHGTIKIEIWRERTKIPIMNDWGFIDLTRDEDLVVGQEDLSAIAYEANAKRPRVKHLVKLDLLPIATFEFEYRSEETLQLLGLTEAGAEVSDLQRETDESFAEENNDLWRTLTSTNSSGGTVDTIMDTLLNDMGPQDESVQTGYDITPTLKSLNPPMSYTDAIGRSLLTGLNVPTSMILPAVCQADPPMHVPKDHESTNTIPELEGRWWEDLLRFWAVWARARLSKGRGVAHMPAQAHVALCTALAYPGIVDSGRVRLAQTVFHKLTGLEYTQHARAFTKDLSLSHVHHGDEKKSAAHSNLQSPLQDLEVDTTMNHDSRSAHNIPNNIPDKEHVALLVRVIETIFRGERHLIDWDSVSELTGIKGDAARKRYTKLRTPSEIKNFVFPAARLRSQDRVGPLSGGSGVAKEEKEVSEYERGIHVRGRTTSNFHAQRTQDRRDRSSSGDTIDKFPQEDIHVYADSELDEPDQTDYLLGWVKSFSPQVDKKEIASHQIQPSDEVPPTVSRSGRILNRPTKFEGLVPLPQRNYTRAKRPATPAATREPTEEVQLVHLGSAEKEVKRLPRGSACASCYRWGIKYKHVEPHSEIVKDVNESVSQDQHVGQPSMSGITQLNGYDGKQASKRTISESPDTAREDNVHPPRKRRKKVPKLGRRLKGWCRYEKPMREPVASKSLDLTGNGHVEPPDECYKLAEASEPDSGRKFSLRITDSGHATLSNNTSRNRSDEEDVTNEEPHKSFDPFSRPNMQETTMNGSVRRRNGEDHSAPKTEKTLAGTDNSMHIHVAGRVLTPSSLGAESTDHLLKQRIMALFGGMGNYAVRHPGTDGSPSEDEALEQDNALFPLDRRKPDASEGVEQRWTGKDEDIEVFDLT